MMLTAVGWLAAAVVSVPAATSSPAVVALLPRQDLGDVVLAPLPRMDLLTGAAPAYAAGEPGPAGVACADF